MSEVRGWIGEWPEKEKSYGHTYEEYQDSFSNGKLCFWKLDEMYLDVKWSISKGFFLELGEK